jgi:hypothetical protein
MAKSPDQIVADIDRKQNEEDRDLIPRAGRMLKEKLAKDLTGGASQRTNLNMGKLPGKSADKKLDLKNYDDIEKQNAAVFLRKSFSDEDAKEMAKQKAFKSGGSVKSSASKRADGCAIKGKTKGRMV